SYTPQKIVFRSNNPLSNRVEIARLLPATPAKFLAHIGPLYDNHKLNLSREISPGLKLYLRR
ncbi:MAG: hypothetical protein WBM41_16950, partial [Arenicellales bacterium]